MDTGIPFLIRIDGIHTARLGAGTYSPGNGGIGAYLDTFHAFYALLLVYECFSLRE
jgi:hypothetical protein